MTLPIRIKGPGVVSARADDVMATLTAQQRFAELRAFRAGRAA